MLKIKYQKIERKRERRRELSEKRLIQCPLCERVVRRRILLIQSRHNLTSAPAPFKSRQSAAAPGDYGRISDSKLARYARLINVRRKSTQSVRASGCVRTALHNNEDASPRIRFKCTFEPRASSVCVLFLFSYSGSRTQKRLGRV